MHSGERQAGAWRRKYLEAVLKQDVGFYDTDARTGDIVFSVSTDTLLVQDAISEKVKLLQLHLLWTMAFFWFPSFSMNGGFLNGNGEILYSSNLKAQDGKF